MGLKISSPSPNTGVSVFLTFTFLLVLQLKKKPKNPKNWSIRTKPYSEDRGRIIELSKTESVFQWFGAGKIQGHAYNDNFGTTVELKNFMDLEAGKGYERLIKKKPPYFLALSHEYHRRKVLLAREGCKGRLSYVLASCMAYISC